MWYHLLSCEKSASDGVASFFAQSLKQFAPALRLAMFSTILRNIVVPLYLSSSSLWSGKNDAIDAVYQLVYTALSQSFLRLPRGENVEFSGGCEGV